MTGTVSLSAAQVRALAEMTTNDLIRVVVHPLSLEAGNLRNAVLVEKRVLSYGDVLASTRVVREDGAVLTRREAGLDD